MWRCKWVELQIRRFKSQALKYDLLLAKNNQRKQLKLEDFKVEDLGAKSLPFPSHTRQEKVMKRKKRKRVEDTIDKAAYMAHHNLFSYFGTYFSILKKGGYVIVPSTHPPTPKKKKKKR